MKLFFLLCLSFTIISYQVSAAGYDTFNHPFVIIVSTTMNKLSQQKFRSKSKEKKQDIRRKAVGAFVDSVLYSITHNNFDEYDHSILDKINEKKPTLEQTLNFVKTNKNTITERIVKNVWDSAGLNSNKHRQLKFHNIESHIQNFFEAFFCDDKPKALISDNIEMITSESYIVL